MEIKHSFCQCFRRNIESCLLRFLLVIVSGLVGWSAELFYPINLQLARIIARIDPLDFDDRGCCDVEEYLREIAQTGDLPY